ncbi:DUF167 family protein [uncultured Maricaulis sp.]|uniref:DUF167 family protein n=1 Tax=uncultured Maricaulis sp. TaxID=174710 RepID=UPI0030D8CEAB
MSGAWLEDQSGLTLRVRLTPNASKDAVEGESETADGLRHLGVRVRAVPEKGRANKAMIAVLSQFLGVPKRDIEVIRGTTSRLKTVRITAGAERCREIAGLLGGVGDER